MSFESVQVLAATSCGTRTFCKNGTEPIQNDLADGTVIIISHGKGNKTPPTVGVHASQSSSQGQGPRPRPKLEAKTKAKARTLEAKAKAMTFEAKATKICPRFEDPGLEDYITGFQVLYPLNLWWPI